MASENGEEAGGDPAKGSDHSFVQRLQRHFGPGVDPRVDLQDEGGYSRAPEREPSSRTPTSVEDFVKRLSPSLDVGSRYEIKGEVASGGMGTILRVWDGDLRRNLAMKVMHGRGTGSGSGKEAGTDATVDPERLGRFLEEAQITGQLDHPGVVPVHDLGIDSKGRCYFTMRFVRGRELKEVLDLAREAKDGWTRIKVLGVILKVCEAMAYAHSKGVVHRDLKPANIMVGRFGETYLMDWGLARVLGRRDSHDLRLKPRPEDASALSLVRTVRRDETEQNPESPLVTMDGDVIGTPSYMAPEQARGKLEEVGPRSDVYSLGAILYYMLTGQAPYVSPGERVSPHTVLARVLDGPPTPVEKIAPNEPPELVAIAAKAMARDPDARYASMLEVADDLQAFVENRVVRAYERGSLAEFKKWVVRNKGMAAGIAGMLLLSFFSILFFSWQQNLENARLRTKEEQTTAAKEEAEANLLRAQESEKMAQLNSQLANEGRAEADRQAGNAKRNLELALRSGYAANILAADFSLKLNDLAEARARLRETVERLRGWEWQHLSLHTNSSLASLGKFVGVEALAFQPGAERALVLTGQGRVITKDLVTGQDVSGDPISLAPVQVGLRTLKQLFSNPALDVDPEGARVALAGAQDGLQVYELDSAERAPGVGTGLAGHEALTSAVAFSPNGRLLASGDEDGLILVRDAFSWTVGARFSLHIGAITALAFSPGSERLASSSRDGSVRIWDLASGRELGNLKGHRGAARAVVWDLLGEVVYSAGDDASIHQWEVATERLQRSLPGHVGAVNALDYDPGHNRLVSGGADRTVRLWDLSTGRAEIFRGHESSVVEVTFDRPGRRVLSGDQEGFVYLWGADGDLTTTTLALHRDAITSVAFDPDQRLLATASEDHEVILWETASGEPLRRLRHDGLVNSVSFSADGRSLLTACHDKFVHLWDVETGSKLRVFGPFDRWVQKAVFTPDGARVILLAGDKKVRVLDAQTTGLLRELGGTRNPIEAFAVDPAGRQLATVGRELALWDLTGDLAAPRSTQKGRNSTVAFRPDGEHLVTGNQEGLLQLWNAQSGEWLVDRQDQTDRLNAVLFSGDGRRVFSASERGEVHARDAESCETLLVLASHGASARALAQSADGKRLAVGYADGSVRIFETSPSKERWEDRRQASELRESVGLRVDELFAEHFQSSEVLRRLQTDMSLTSAEREAALRLAYLRGDDPLPLLSRSLEECLDPEHEPAVYARARARGRAAQGMKDGTKGSSEQGLDGLVDLVLGVAAYRAGDHAEAERTLLREVVEDSAERVERRGIFGTREQSLRLLFLCMAQCRTGHLAEAERSLRLAKQRVYNDLGLSQRPELLGLIDEVETLLRASFNPTGS